MNDNWYIYHKDLYESCESNEQYLDILSLHKEAIRSLDTSIFPKNKNKDLIIAQDNLNELFIKNKLKTIRLGNVESRFLIKQKFNYDIIGDNETLQSRDDDFRMRNNAGLYYVNQSDKANVHKWWTDNTFELLNTPSTVFTSCYLFLPYDLLLLSLCKIKNKYINNFGLLVDLIMLFENKKILVISNGVGSMRKSFNSGLQRAYKPTIPKFTLYTLKTPQTTIGMSYPHSSSKDTTEWIMSEVEKKYDDFDVALLACGCYGAPLTNLLSKKYVDKNIIYMGSMLYTLFGLYSSGIEKPIFNPSLFDINGFTKVTDKCPRPCKKIENGKYWNN